MERGALPLRKPGMFILVTRRRYACWSALSTSSGSSSTLSITWLPSSLSVDTFTHASLAVSWPCPSKYIVRRPLERGNLGIWSHLDYYSRWQQLGEGQPLASACLRKFVYILGNPSGEVFPNPPKTLSLGFGEGV